MAAIIIPATGDVANATVADSFTFIGAVCSSPVRCSGYG